MYTELVYGVFVYTVASFCMLVYTEHRLSLGLLNHSYMFIMLNR